MFFLNCEHDIAFQYPLPWNWKVKEETAEVLKNRVNEVIINTPTSLVVQSIFFPFLHHNIDSAQCHSQRQFSL